MGRRMANRWQSHCPGCGRFLLEEPAGSGLRTCRDCGHVIDYLLFPAARGKARVDGGALRAEGESACFNHPHKRAEHECEACGKFLCALCAVQVGAHRICPECLHAGRKARDRQAAQRMASLGDAFVQERFVPGAAATSLVVIGLLLFFIAGLTAPLAIYFGIRGLGKQGSLVETHRTRAIVGIVLGVLQLGLWCIMVYNAFLSPNA
jgi:hypothetical protein